jgi:hypothetical protein
MHFPDQLDRRVSALCLGVEDPVDGAGHPDLPRAVPIHCVGRRGIRRQHQDPNFHVASPFSRHVSARGESVSKGRLPRSCESCPSGVGYRLQQFCDEVDQERIECARAHIEAIPVKQSPYILDLVLIPR